MFNKSLKIVYYLMYKNSEKIGGGHYECLVTTMFVITHCDDT